MAPFPDIPRRNRKLTISPRRVQRGLEGRRGTLLRTDEAGVQDQTVAGKTLVAGDGQATFEISFPVTFIDQPALSFGAAVDDNEGHGARGVDASNPTYNAMVIDWNRTARAKLPGIWYYRGATLTVSLVGSPGYVWIHWQARGRAFRNPAKDLGNTGGTP